jgi:hypothetical protein
MIASVISILTAWHLSGQLLVCKLNIVTKTKTLPSLRHSDLMLKLTEATSGVALSCRSWRHLPQIAARQIFKSRL